MHNLGLWGFGGFLSFQDSETEVQKYIFREGDWFTFSNAISVISFH